MGYRENIIPSIMLQKRILYDIFQTVRDPIVTINREMKQAIWGLVTLKIRAYANHRRGRIVSIVFTVSVVIFH